MDENMGFFRRSPVDSTGLVNFQRSKMPLNPLFFGILSHRMKVPLPLNDKRKRFLKFDWFYKIHARSPAESGGTMVKMAFWFQFYRSPAESCRTPGAKNAQNCIL